MFTYSVCESGSGSSISSESRSARIRFRIRMQDFDGKKLREKNSAQIFFFSFLDHKVQFSRPLWRKSKLQEKHSALTKEHPALVFFFPGPFLLSWIRIRIANPDPQHLLYDMETTWGPCPPRWASCPSWRSPPPCHPSSGRPLFPCPAPRCSSRPDKWLFKEIATQKWSLPCEIKSELLSMCANGLQNILLDWCWKNKVSKFPLASLN